MMKKRIFKIRSKETGEFLYVGYNQKHSWSVYPSAAIEHNPHIFRDKSKFEVVVFEYELKETNVIDLK